MSDPNCNALPYIPTVVKNTLLRAALWYLGLLLLLHLGSLRLDLTGTSERAVDLTHLALGQVLVPIHIFTTTSTGIIHTSSNVVENQRYAVPDRRKPPLAPVRDARSNHVCMVVLDKHVM